MMLRLITIAVLLLVLHHAQAMPDHPAMMRMSGELSHEIDGHNETSSNATADASAEDDADDDDDDLHDEEEDDDDDDDIHVQGKSSSCPPRQPEIVEIEKQCLAEYKVMKKKFPCTTTTMPPTTEMSMKKAPESASLKIEIGSEMTSEGPTDKPAHKHHARMSFYYYCILKKMELLNEDEVPSKSKLEAWIAANVTDEAQREQTKKKLASCLSELNYELEETETSTDSSEETEQSTESSSKFEELLKYDASKMLVCCIHHVECPVIKYP